MRHWELAVSLDPHSGQPLFLQLADAIAYLLDNPAEARRMSHAAFTRVADRCSPAILARTLEEIYLNHPADAPDND